jgi:hypothetical protein
MNVRWATPKEQARNRHNTRMLAYRGETKPLVVWAELLGLTANTIRLRIDTLGKSVEEALIHD